MRKEGGGSISGISPSVNASALNALRADGGKSDSDNVLEVSRFGEIIPGLLVWWLGVKNALLDD